ncbi:HD domain-containing protein [Bacteroides sp. 51]|nr:HD domain-containing protein [Bacteroides sp. 51]
MMSKRKIINDPVFGFINIPEGLLYDIIQHPVLQRLTRIKQMGITSVVYPGAQHTRFQHSLGAFYLTGEAIIQLRSKGHDITNEEAEAVRIAILMHDVGHGPFSHVLENTIIKGVPHEEISLLLMKRINEETNGKLDLAIRIFKDEYPKKFLHQLVSGQLDMDRLDYLRRDSFYTGVTEGNIGSARIIKMLNVKDDHLVIESKGIYSIENFLMARRLMYWQVYLHKTSVAYESMLVSALSRAKELAQQGVELFTSPAFHFFLYQNIDRNRFYRDNECLENFIQLDDNDIWTSLKVWSNHPDKILSTLSQGLINRKIFKVEISNEPFSEEQKKELTLQISNRLGISFSEATTYFVSTPSTEKNMYDPADDSIDIMYNNGNIKNIAEASDMLNISLLSKKVKKYYICYLRSDAPLQNIP